MVAIIFRCGRCAARSLFCRLGNSSLVSDARMLASTNVDQRAGHQQELHICQGSPVRTLLKCQTISTAGTFLRDGDDNTFASFIQYDFSTYFPFAHQPPEASQFLVPHFLEVCAVLFHPNRRKKGLMKRRCFCFH